MNKTQKIIISVWIILSVVLGWKWMLDEQYSVVITAPLYFIFMGAILFLPMFILYKFWKDKK